MFLIVSYKYKCASFEVSVFLNHRSLLTVQNSTIGVEILIEFSCLHKVTKQRTLSTFCIWGLIDFSEASNNCFDFHWTFSYFLPCLLSYTIEMRKLLYFKRIDLSQKSSRIVWRILDKSRTFESNPLPNTIGRWQNHLFISKCQTRRHLFVFI